MLKLFIRQELFNESLLLWMQKINAIYESKAAKINISLFIFISLKQFGNVKCLLFLERQGKMYDIYCCKAHTE